VSSPRTGTPAEQRWLREVIDYASRRSEEHAGSDVTSRLAFMRGAIEAFAAPERQIARAVTRRLSAQCGCGFPHATELTDGEPPTFAEQRQAAERARAAALVAEESTDGE